MSGNSGKATINDVSKLAHVSKSTVSHVLNGTKNVREETRQKVLEAIKETGYTPNFLAKAFKMSETKTIGLVISDIRNQYFIDVIYAIYEEAKKYGYMVMLANSDDDPMQELEAVQSLYGRRVDGLIISPTAGSEKKSYPFIKKNHIPVVYVDRQISVENDWVGIENEKSMEMLAEHFIKLGHTRIGLVVGMRGINTTEERINGYCNALRKNNILYDENLLILGESRSEPARVNTIKCMQELKETGRAPTAIIAANNLMAIGLMRALKEMKYRVPQDIAVAVFDEFEWSDLFQPQLTNIVQPCNEIGKKATELLLRRIKNPESAAQKICFYPKMVIRESSGEQIE